MNPRNIVFALAAAPLVAAAAQKPAAPAKPAGPAKGEFAAAEGDSSGGTVMDGTAARVDAAVITIGDVMAEIRNNPRWRAGVNLADRKEFAEMYRRVVRHLVERKLILKAADEAKMDLQEWVVDSRVQEIVRDHFGGDVNRLNQTLAEAKTTFGDWRRTVREDMVVAAMRYRKIEQNVSASPGAMRAEYEANPGRYAVPPSVTLSVILLAPGKDAKPPAERAEDLLKQLAAGADFAKLARENSADTRAAQGGLWENVNPKDYFLPEIVAHIDALKPGETSKRPLVFGRYAVIVRKISQKDGGRRSFAEAYADIEANVRNAERERLYNEWIDALKRASFVRMYDLPAERMRLKN